MSPIMKMQSPSIVVAIAMSLAAAPSARASAESMKAPAAAGGWTAIAAEADDRADDRADELYDDGRDAIEDGKYDQAVQIFTRLIELKSNRTDAALYWKAYSLAKLARRDEALTTLADLQKRFADSRWIKDAKALEVEVRQASGQTVSPGAQTDEDTKLIALQYFMNNNPDGAVPLLQQMLNGPNSPKVKDRVLFVLSQNRSAQARQLLASVAKGGTNPDLQLKAIHYLGIMGDEESRQLLADVYATSSDASIKRTILRGFMVSGDRARLLNLAKTEKDAALRGEAVQQLGVMGARSELADLYQTETSTEVKKRILQAMFIGGDAAKLGELAKTEKDPELRKVAIRNLGLMGASRTGDTLRAMYLSDTDTGVRKAVIQGLFLQDNAKTLVELARAEKDVELKKEIVSKLALMHSKEAQDYLMELLK